MYEKMLSELYVDPKEHIVATQKHISGETKTHFHEFFEIEIVLGGHGKQMLNGSEYALQRGCVYLLTPTDFHMVQSQPTLELINIMFDSSVISKQLFASLLYKQSDCFLSLDERGLEPFLVLSRLLIEENECADSYNALRREALLNCLLVQIARNTDTIEGERLKKEKALVSKAVDYLYANFKENPSLSQLATACGYSPNYFSKLFTKLMGKGYNDFLNSLKVGHAKILLASTDSTVSEIAFQCGFCSLSNFYRVFAAEVGATPLEYRSKLS